jgi:NAD-dependent SIR2 family protein deacetylase
MLSAASDFLALSGIPDYRSPKGSYSVGHKPMQHDEFIGAHSNRQRYWSRSFQGWAPFRGAKPNEGHLAVSRLQELGIIGGIVTQNVDALHQRAGARRVVDLHGRNDRVRCLSCQSEIDRGAFQEVLAASNGGPGSGSLRTCM